MMFRRVVVGLDFLSPSLAAARLVVRRFSPSEVVFVHVVPVSPRVGADPDALARARDAQSRLREIANALRVENADFDIAIGDVGKELCLIAEQVDADLICIGASSDGTGGFGRAARTLMAQDRVSFLLVPTPATTGSVHAVWSGAPRHAVVLETANRLARSWGAELNALCVLPVTDGSASDPDGIAPSQLADLLEQAQGAGVDTLRVDVSHDPWQLASYAEQQRPGLMVVDAVMAQMVLDEAASAPRRGWSRPIVRCPVLVQANVAIDRTLTIPRRDSSATSHAPSVPESVTAARSKRIRLMGTLRRRHKPPDDGGAA